MRGSTEGGSGLAQSLSSRLVPIRLVDLQRGPESLVSRLLVGDILVTGGIKRQTVENERQAGEDADRKRRQGSCLQVERGA